MRVCLFRHSRVPDEASTQRPAAPHGYARTDMPIGRSGLWPKAVSHGLPCALMTDDPDPLPDPPAYGRSLPAFCANLLVRDPRVSAGWYREVLGARVRHADGSFAAMELPAGAAGVPLMLHADPTYTAHPWAGDLRAGVRRGLGAELRLLGPDPDAVATAAHDLGGTVLQEPADTPHGWRDTIVEDPDGYAWAVGVPLPPDEA